jgi:hypothetical protein
MPEILEIRRYADFIRNKLKNNKIIDIKIINGRYKKGAPEMVAPFFIDWPRLYNISIFQLLLAYLKAVGYQN